jgi:tetratricopeptide (TPR) repeat protein
MYPSGKHSVSAVVTCLAVVSLVMFLGSSVAVADVVHLKGGKKLEGTVKQASPNSPTVTVQTSIGAMTVQRSQIERIEQEDAAQGAVRLANQYLQKQDFMEARKYFELALKSDPNLKAAQDGLKAVQAELEFLDKQRQQTTAKTVSETLDLVERLVKEKRFKEAYYTMKAINIDSAPDLRAKYNKVGTEGAYGAALIAIDQQNKPKAEQLLEMSLRFDSTNAAARKKLAELWEEDPSKRDKVIAEYEKSDKPEDQLKLADMLMKTKDYKRALTIYAQNVRKWKDWPIERVTSIRQSLKVLETEFAVQSNYEMALRAYSAYLTITPDADQEPLLRYQIKLQAQQTNLNDPAAVAALGEFIEEHGYTDGARKAYVRALELDPKRAEALEGMQRLGELALTDVAALYADGQFGLAYIKAEDVVKTYAVVPDVVARAKQIQQQGEQAQAQMQAEAGQRAQAFALRGDDYYAQAQSYLSAYMSKDTDSTKRVISPKQEAAKYYRLAVSAWQSALSLDSSLADPVSGDLGRKISEASARLATLTSTAPPYVPRYESQ